MIKKRPLFGKNFRLIIPDLGELSPDIKYGDPRLESFRLNIAEKLFKKQKSRSLEYWSIALEIHPISKKYHLDILVIYSKRVQNSFKRYDYLIKHGNLTKYRTLNQAILDYNLKEDPNCINNIPKDIMLADKAKTKQGLYDLLEKEMLKDPFKFESYLYIHDHNLNKHIINTNWLIIIKQIKIKQEILCSKLLHNKKGFKLITRQLIEEKLTKKELKIYDSWSGYQTIVDHLNQIPTYGYNRPHKTKNLLIVGRPNTGKTTLALQIQKYASVYYKDVSNWFPSYKPEVYHMILWNEFSLKGGTRYPKLLNFLEGTKLDLEYKGGSVLKTDNQLIYMTSNMSLKRHINIKFKYEYDRLLSHNNLSARITEVTIPNNLTLFILCKLFT